MLVTRGLGRPRSHLATAGMGGVGPPPMPPAVRHPAILIAANAAVAVLRRNGADVRARANSSAIAVTVSGFGLAVNANDSGAGLAD